MARPIKLEAMRQRALSAEMKVQALESEAATMRTVMRDLQARVLPRELLTAVLVSLRRDATASMRAGTLERLDQHLADRCAPAPVPFSLLPLDVGFDLRVHPELEVDLRPHASGGEVIVQYLVGQPGGPTTFRGSLREVTDLLRAAGYRVRS